MTELRSIINKRREIGEALRLAWYFEKWYEKVILVVLMTLGVWKLVNIVGGIL